MIEEVRRVATGTGLESALMSSHGYNMGTGTAARRPQEAAATRLAHEFDRSGACRVTQGRFAES